MGRNKSVTQTGQVALIILTVMAIALTLGLSLSQRVITDLEITQEEEKSAQAFSAAEGGVEEALRILDQGGDVDSELDTVQIAKDLGVDSVDIETTAVGGQTEFTYPLPVSPGDSAFIWLRDHDENGNLLLDQGYGGGSINICWQNQAAVEIIYFYDSGGYNISRFAYNSNSTSSIANGFSDPTGTECAGLDTSASINLGGYTPLFLVVRPFYSETEIGFSGSEAFPVQGNEITSTGEVVRSEEEVISRRIKAYQSWEIPSEFFFHSVFANTGVTTQ